jgi:hypothetical protein
MPDWHTGEWLHNGICDLVDEGGGCGASRSRRTWTSCAAGSACSTASPSSTDDPFSDPVELQDVVDAAHRLQTRPDKDWA